MEDLNLVKVWESKLRKEIDGLKNCKDRVSSDSTIPKQVRDRFVDILRTLKMNMIQVMAKCTQLRSESLPEQALKVRIEKLKFEYEEVLKNLEHLVSTIKPKDNPGSKIEFDDIHSAISKELLGIKNIVTKTKEQLEAHRHNDYEQRLEILECENQELRRVLSKVQDESTETFEILHLLKKRVEKLENTQNESKESFRSNTDFPKKRVLLKPSSHAEDLLKL